MRKERHEFLKSLGVNNYIPKECPFCEEIVEAYEVPICKCLGNILYHFPILHIIKCEKCGDYRVIANIDSKDCWDRLKSRKESAKKLLAQKKKENKEIIWMEASPEKLCNDEIKRDVAQGHAEFIVISDL